MSSPGPAVIDSLHLETHLLCRCHAGGQQRDDREHVLQRVDHCHKRHHRHGERIVVSRLKHHLPRPRHKSLGIKQVLPGNPPSTPISGSPRLQLQLISAIAMAPIPALSVTFQPKHCSNPVLTLYLLSSATPYPRTTHRLPGG